MLAVSRRREKHVSRFRESCIPQAERVGGGDGVRRVIENF